MTEFLGWLRHVQLVAKSSQRSIHYVGYKKISTFRAKALCPELIEGVGEKHVCFYTSECIKTTRDKISTNQMDLMIIRNKQAKVA